MCRSFQLEEGAFFEYCENFVDSCIYFGAFRSSCRGKWVYIVRGAANAMGPVWGEARVGEGDNCVISQSESNLRVTAWHWVSLPASTYQLYTLHYTPHPAAQAGDKMVHCVPASPSVIISTHHAVKFWISLLFLLSQILSIGSDTPNSVYNVDL